MTKTKDYDGVETAGSKEQLMKMLGSENPEDVWVIGGQSVYEQLLPCCVHAYVTFNQNEDACDSFFPNLEDDPDWVRDKVLTFGVNDDGFPYVTYMYRNGNLQKFPDFKDWGTSEQTTPKNILTS